MSIFRTTAVLAGNGTNNNLLAGSKFEFLSRPAAVTVFASSDGGTVADVQLDFTLGNVVVAEDINPNLAAVVGNIVRNQDGIGAGVGDAGDRIQLRGRNLNAVARNLNVLLDISELG